MHSEPPLGAAPDTTGGKRVGLTTAVALLAGTVVLVVAAGLFMGYRYFWNKPDRVLRLDNEAARWTQILQQDPKNLEALYQLGWTYYQKGDLNQALTYTKAAAEVQPDHAGVQYNLGLVYFDLKQYQQAVSEFKALADKYPQHELAWLGLGRTYLELGKNEEAVTTLQQTLKINVTSSDTHLALGTAFERLQKRDQAIAEYKEALRYDPQFTPATEALRRLGVTNP